MFCRKLTASYIVCALIALTTLSVFAQKKGAESISAADLKAHLTFIASDELKGRNTPSPELKIAAKYLATRAESYGFKPLMPDGSFFQRIPIDYVSVSESATNLVIKSPEGSRSFSFPQDFSVNGGSNGAFSGSVVFVGFGLSSTDNGWDDYKGVDVNGKIVVMLNARLPAEHALNSRQNRRYISSRARSAVAQSKGAAAVLVVASPLTEDRMKNSNEVFRNNPATIYGGYTPSVSSFLSGTIRHSIASEVLGVTEETLREMFDRIANGIQVEGKNFPGTTIDIFAESEVTGNEYTQNVVAFYEGSDPDLKDEYVFFGAHYDHVGERNGQIYNGADDDGSGTVSLLEIAQAVSMEKMKRSVVIVWHTGEEKGLRGARYFTANSPVPLDKISAQINLDMIGRNDPDTVFVIGPGRISTELDKITVEKNDKHIKLNLDYKFDAPDDPNNFYGRSDHYMYAQYGIPIVFFFTDVHEDYHRPTDTVDKINFDKMERIARLAFYVGYEVANRKEMLPLDADPKITARGVHYPAPPRRR